MSRPAPARPVRVGAWLAFLVLAGLIAMHGLGAHGSMSSTHGGMSVDAAAMGHAEHPETLVPAGAPTLAPSLPEAAMDPMAQACVVVLGLGLLLLLGLALPDAGTPGTSRVCDRTRAVLRRARSPDPPDLLELSICRC